jgi:hypothetical protein
MSVPLLQEVAALRAEVRAAIAVKEEIASVRAAVASLANSSVAVENVTAADGGVPTVDVSGARSAASVVKDAIRSGVLQSGNVSRQSVVRAGVACRLLQVDQYVRFVDGDRQHVDFYMSPKPATCRDLQIMNIKIIT